MSINNEIYNLYKNQPKSDDTFYWDKMHTFKRELTRIYNSNSSFSEMSRDSVHRMLRLNLKYRIIPLHIFGLNIEI